jgi:hypothetical protein
VRSVCQPDSNRVDVLAGADRCRVPNDRNQIPSPASGTAGESIIFVVDDDESVRDALKSLFQSVGLKVQMFASAPELLRGELPDAAASRSSWVHRLIWTVS